MRKIRRIIEVGFPIAGMAVVFGAVLMIPPSTVQLQLQLIAVLIGVLMIEAGVWGLTQPFLPNERKYNALRDAADDFIDLVRELNSAALLDREADGETTHEVDASLVKMHAAVDAMANLAGLEE